MKSIRIILIYFFIILATSAMITCGGGGSAGDSPGAIDVSGMYDVIFAIEGETPEPEVWILKQTGNDVTILFGDVPPTGLTVSGSNLVIAWDFYDSASVHITVNATLAISGETISGSGTLAVDEETIPVNFSMTRTSTSATVPLFHIPEASITVDGVITDWASVANYVTDTTGDASGGTGTDIQSVKIARDSTRVYLLVNTNAALSTDYNYQFVLRDTSFQDIVCIMLLYEAGQWKVGGNDTQTDTPISIDGEVSVNTGYIELSFLYSDVFTPGEKYIVEQMMNPNGVDDSVDDTMFIGYTFLPLYTNMEAGDSLNETIPASGIKVYRVHIPQDGSYTFSITNLVSNLSMIFSTYDPADASLDDLEDNVYSVVDNYDDNTDKTRILSFTGTPLYVYVVVMEWDSVDSSYTISVSAAGKSGAEMLETLPGIGEKISGQQLTVADKWSEKN